MEARVMLQTIQSLKLRDCQELQDKTNIILMLFKIEVWCVWCYQFIIQSAIIYITIII